MKTLIIITLAALVFSDSCDKRETKVALKRLDIYAGYVAGIDEDGYRHAVGTFCDELGRQPDLLAGAEVRVIRYGDRHSLKAVPVLKIEMPEHPDCRAPGKLFKQGSSAREKQCREMRERFASEYAERVQAIRLVLEASPLSTECVSYRNLLTRLSYEPERPATVVITDPSRACADGEGELEPLPDSGAPLVVIQVASGSDFTEQNRFIRKYLSPDAVVPGTSAEHAVAALRNTGGRASRR